MKHNQLTFELLDQEITGVASDYLIECKDKDGATIVKEWVTLPTGSVYKDTQFSLVGPSNGTLRILPINGQKQMASNYNYIKFPVVFPASEWEDGKGITIPVAGSQIRLGINAKAPDAVKDAFEALDATVYDAEDGFVRFVATFDANKGDIGEKGRDGKPLVYINLDTRGEIEIVNEDEFNDQGDLTDPEVFLALLEDAGYEGEIVDAKRSRKPKPAKASGGRPPRDTSGGSSRPKQKAKPEVEDDEDEVEETPKKKVANKTRVTNRIEESPKKASASDDLMARLALLVEGTNLLINELELGSDVAANIVSMQMANMANGGYLGLN